MLELELSKWNYKNCWNSKKMVELSIGFTHLSFCFIDTTSVNSTKKFGEIFVLQI